MPHAYREGDKPVPGYTLMKFLGRGGFGQVWQAAAPGGTKVGFKIIDLEGKQGLKEFRAVRLMRNVVHPNLVPIMAFWLKDDRGTVLDGTLGDDGDSNTFLRSKAAELLIAMGLGEKNLLDRLKECEREGSQGIPPEELLEYMEAAAKAVDYLNNPIHDMGSSRPVAIQHCDIKPQNILIVGGGAQVCDFGLAREMGASRSTSPSVSIAYTPPELLDGRSSPATDQYALAVTYIELRTGSLPFTSENPAAMIYAHLQGRLDLTRLGPAERRIIQKATSLDPKDRYRTTAEMVRALRDVLAASQQRRADIMENALLLAPGREIVPGYRLSKSLGSGSYGAVWEAVGPGGTHLAFKIIQELDQAAGQQEYKSLELIKGVEHKYLMEIYAYWLLDSMGQVIPDEMRGQASTPKPATLVIASKLAKTNLGQRLKECLAQGLKGIPVEDLLRYIDQAAKALDYLNSAKHKMGDKYVAIQHRDIKPENILLTSNDDVKIADFGLAKVVEGLSTVIHTRSMGLTPYYAAPEMFDGRITKWTDQYCLAVTYYHLRTGLLPFKHVNSVHDIMRAHLQGKLDFSRLPPDERKVIQKASAVNPERRFPTCSDMTAELIKACQDQLSSPIEESFFGGLAPAPPKSPDSKVEKPKPASTREVEFPGKRKILESPAKSRPNRPAEAAPPMPPPTKPIPSPEVPPDPPAKAPRSASGRQSAGTRELTPPPVVSGPVTPGSPARGEPAQNDESGEGMPTLSQPMQLIAAARAAAEEEVQVVPEAQETQKPRLTAPLRPVILALTALARSAARLRGVAQSRRVRWAAAAAVIVPLLLIGIWMAINAYARNNARTAVQQLIDEGKYSQAYEQVCNGNFSASEREGLVASLQAAALKQAEPPWLLALEQEDPAGLVQVDKLLSEIPQACFSDALQSLQLKVKRLDRNERGRLCYEHAQTLLDSFKPAEAIPWYRKAIDWSKSGNRNQVAAALLGRARASIRVRPADWGQAKRDVDELQSVANRLGEVDRAYLTAVIALLRDHDAQSDVLIRLKDSTAAATPALPQSSEELRLLTEARQRLLDTARTQFETAELPRAKDLADQLRLDSGDPNKDLYPQVITALDRKDRQGLETLLSQVTKPPRLSALCEAYISLAENETDWRAIEKMTTVLNRALASLWPTAGGSDDEQRRSQIESRIRALGAKAANLRIDTHLDDASSRLTNKQYADCRKLLKDLEQDLAGDAPGSERKVRWETLYALVLKNQPQQPQDTSTAASICLRLLTKGDLRREAELCVALADITKQQPRYMEQALPVLKKALTRLTDMDRALVQTRYDALAAVHFERLEAQAAQYLSKPAEFAVALRKAEEYAADVTDGTSRLEALRTLALAKTQPDAQTFAKLDHLLAQKKPPRLLELCSAYYEVGGAAVADPAALAGAAARLGKAAGEATDAKEQQEILAWRNGFAALRIALLAKNASGRSTALQEFRDLSVDKTPADRLANLCQALMPLARDEQLGDEGKGKLLAAVTQLKGDVGEELQRQLREIIGKGVAAMLQSAYGHLQAGQFADCRKTLQEAQRQAVAEPESTKARQLLILLDLNDPNAAKPARQKAIQSLEAEFSKFDTWQKDLCRALLDLADRDREHLAEIKAALMRVQNRIPAEWSNLLPYLNVMVHSEDGNAAAREALKLKPEVEFLRPLGPARQQKVASILFAAADHQRVTGGWTKPFGDSSQVLDEVIAWLQQAEKLLPAEAQQSSPVNRLHLRVNLALAHAQRNAPELRRIAKEILNEKPKVSSQFPLSDAFPLWLAYARGCAESKTAKDQAAAITSYVQVLSLLQSHAAEIELAPKLEYDEILAPATQLAKSVVTADVAAAEKAEAAKLCAFTGNFLLTHSGSPEWSAADLDQQAFEQFDRAYQLVAKLSDSDVDRATKARYAAGKARARLYYAGDLERMAQEANDAVTLAPELPGGYALLGYVAYQRARAEPKKDTKKDLLKQAAKHFLESISKSEQQGSAAGDKLFCLTYESRAQRELAELAGIKSEEQRDALEEAVRAGQSAVKEQAAARRRLDARLALGQALEDRARYLFEEHFDDFEIALQEYVAVTKATGKDTTLGKMALLGLGRCRLWQGYRGKTLSKTETEQWDKCLRDATADLQKVVASAPNSAEEAEAHFWLAPAYYLQDNVKDNLRRGDEEFDNARKVAKQLGNRDWLISAYKMQAGWAVDQARKAAIERWALARQRLEVYWQLLSDLPPSESAVAEEIKTLEPIVYKTCKIAAEEALSSSKKNKGNGDLERQQLTILKEATAGMKRCSAMPLADAEAALLLGTYYEDVTGELTTAVKEYEQGLADMPGGPTELHINLQLRRNRLLFLPALKAQRKIGDLIRSADTAAGWASNPNVNNNEQMKARALGFAGIVRSKAMAYFDKSNSSYYQERAPSTEEYRIAADKLEAAVEADPRNFEDGWEHRFWLAYSKYELMQRETDPAKKKKYQQEGKKWATEAKDLAKAKQLKNPDAESAKDLDGLLNALGSD